MAQFKEMSLAITDFVISDRPVKSLDPAASSFKQFPLLANCSGSLSSGDAAVNIQENNISHAQGLISGGSFNACTFNFKST